MLLIREYIFDSKPIIDLDRILHRELKQDRIVYGDKSLGANSMS